MNDFGETSVTYKGEPICLNWEKYGLEVHFEAGDLRSECRINISAALSLSREFVFPDNRELVSGVYRIVCPQEFNAQVTIKIQHCVEEEGIEQLSFASCSDSTPPFHFHVIDGGRFTARIGEIHMKKFSFFGIFGKHAQSYLASLYCSSAPSLYRSSVASSLSPSYHSWNLYFSVVKNCNFYQMYLERYFSDERLTHDTVRLHVTAVVHFERNKKSIKLDIPCSEYQIQSGWFLNPLVYPSIYKSEIKSYDGGRPPHCELLLKSGNASSSLEYKLILDGVKGPNNFIKICQPVPQRKYCI